MLRLLYNILPKPLQEVFKLKYYNLKNNKYKFGLENRLYSTRFKKLWSVLTIKPLYFIVKGIDRYEKYYKIKDKDILLDCGANDGSLSVVYSQKVGLGGKVFAFEPDSKNIERFKRNMLLNNEFKNIELVNKVIWDKDDTIVFYEAGTVGSSIFYEDKNSQKVIKQATSIDIFLLPKKLEKLDFIKMDIEGAEIEVLKGSIKTIDKYQPNFAIASYHIINDKPTYIAIESFFSKIGYPYKTEFFDDGEIMTYAGKSINK